MTQQRHALASIGFRRPAYEAVQRRGPPLLVILPSGSVTVVEAVVELWLSVQGDDPVTRLEELSDWLSREPDLRGLVRPAAVVPDPGELGALSDVLIAAVGTGGALSVLATSLRAFFAQPRGSDVRIVVTTPDRRTVELDAQRVRDVDSVVRQVLGQDG